MTITTKQWVTDARHPKMGRGLNAYQAFYRFDGEFLDFPEKSFDRIFVNDAFHHIPNVETVLKEFNRILKDDGIIGMSEPGRNHSQTESSQYEMRVYNVIENDFVIEDVWSKAQLSGFQEIEICPVLRNSYLSFDEYIECTSGRVPSVVTKSLIQDTINHSIFFLYKNSAKKAPAVKVFSRDEFNEVFYFQKYPEIALAVAKGQFADGWQHYELHGRMEGRLGKPS
ncbi:MAG: class I SAM-dependent methyltransferase [Methylomonas sp.]|nr:class I SAM-dependent methyltransferase [Methylomonas sp.]